MTLADLKITPQVISHEVTRLLVKDLHRKSSTGIGAYPGLQLTSFQFPISCQELADGNLDEISSRNIRPVVAELIKELELICSLDQEIVFYVPPEPPESPVYGKIYDWIQWTEDPGRCHVMTWLGYDAVNDRRVVVVTVLYRVKPIPREGAD